jgi:hypothetical protein
MQQPMSGRWPFFSQTFQKKPKSRVKATPAENTYTRIIPAASAYSGKWHRPAMAGLGLFNQKSVIAVTMPIVTAFKFCIGHRKNGLLNR